MYNVGAVYEIIGRVVNGTCVSAYVLKDRRNSNLQTVDKGIVEQLALNKQLYNCRAQVYNQIVNLKGINCKLSKLPKYDMQCKRIVDGPVRNQNKQAADLIIVGKVLSGRRVKYYILNSLVDKSKKVQLSYEDTLRAAYNGRVLNAKVQRNGESVVLRSNNGYSLSNIQIYRER